jgi:DNA-3-methyladenine glycosylase I
VEALKRCDWALGVSDTYRRYHDEEWGVPVSDDRRHFEFLLLEGAQAGLSWSVILHRREGYRRAFAGFDPQRVARFNRASVRRLLADSGIVRNRQKIQAAIDNAGRFLDIQEEFGSFNAYIWRFVDGQPLVNRRRRMSDVPATTRHSDRLSRDLRQRGFRFVGSTIIHAHMQATGLINDHLLKCYRHGACARLRPRLEARERLRG